MQVKVLKRQLSWDWYCLNINKDLMHYKLQKFLEMISLCYHWCSKIWCNFQTTSYDELSPFWDQWPALQASRKKMAVFNIIHIKVMLKVLLWGYWRFVLKYFFLSSQTLNFDFAVQTHCKWELSLIMIICSLSGNQTWNPNCSMLQLHLSFNWI